MSRVFKAVKKFVTTWRVYFEGLLTLLFFQPINYMVFKRVFRPDVPFGFLIGWLIFLFIVTLWFFCSCVTPDKKTVKMRWW